MAPKAKAAAAAPAAKAEPKAKPAAKKKEKPEGPKPEEEIPKVSPPDNDEFKASIDKVNQDIEALKKEQQKLSDRINERSSGKTEFQAQKGELRNQLNELSSQMDALQEKKDEINKTVGNKVQEGKEMRQQLNKMKKTIGYSTESEIDDRIATIEFKLWTDSISLKEEKEYLKEIQELKRNRPKVSQVNRMEEGLQSMDKGAGLKGDISSINEEMFKLREAKRAISAKYSELVNGRREQLGDLDDVMAKKDELSKQISEKVKERNQIRDDYKAAEKAYYAYQAELRRIRQERQAEERQKWQAEQERRRTLQKAEKLDEQPYVAEITLIEQTILFCKSLTQTKGSEKEEEKKETVHNNPDGTEVLLKKEDRDEFWFAPTAKKKGKSGKKAGGGEGGSKKPIKHNAETFRLFDQLKLDAPITTDDIPATLEKLEAQLVDYNVKVKKWEETRDEKKRRILEGLEDPDEKKEEEAKEEEAKEEEKAEEKEEEKEEAKEEEDKAED